MLDLKRYIKLYGPSLDRGFEALNNLIKELKKQYPYGEYISHIISIIDPSVDLLTRENILVGQQILGDIDFIFEWKGTPRWEEIRGLMRSIDDALLYTGCSYTISTKE